MDDGTLPAFPVHMRQYLDDFRIDLDVVSEAISELSDKVSLTLEGTPS